MDLLDTNAYPCKGKPLHIQKCKTILSDQIPYTTYLENEPHYKDEYLYCLSYTREYSYHAALPWIRDCGVLSSPAPINARPGWNQRWKFQDIPVPRWGQGGRRVRCGMGLQNPHYPGRTWPRAKIKISKKSPPIPKPSSSIPSSSILIHTTSFLCEEVNIYSGKTRNAVWYLVKWR